MSSAEKIFCICNRKIFCVHPFRKYFVTQWIRNREYWVWWVNNNVWVWHVMLCHHWCHYLMCHRMSWKIFAVDVTLVGVHHHINPSCLALNIKNILWQSDISILHFCNITQSSCLHVVENLNLTSHTTYQNSHSQNKIK